MARVKALAEIAEGLKAKVYTFENLSPVSQVSVYVKAGSRYEPNAVPGISHFLRASALLTTQRFGHFAVTRYLERVGKFHVTSDREYIVYRVDCLRDKLGYALRFIDDTLHRPEFRPWELFDIVQPKVRGDLQRFKSNQILVANEALHKAAYRGGLAHSVFMPEHQVSKINKEHLFDYVNTSVVPSRISIVGLGVAKDELSGLIENTFNFSDADYSGVDGKSRYVGGEARIQAGFDKTLVNYVVEGSSINDVKMLAAIEVISTILGGYQQINVKYGEGCPKSLAGALNHYSQQVKPSIININHSDTGLFGISIHGPNSLIGNATRDAIKHVKKILSSVSESDLKVAKNSCIAKLLIMSENHEASYQALSRRCSAGLEKHDPIDGVANVTLGDIQAAVGKLLKSKPTIVSVGNPRFVPYLDELDS